MLRMLNLWIQWMNSLHFISLNQLRYNFPAFKANNLALLCISGRPNICMLIYLGFNYSYRIEFVEHVRLGWVHILGPKFRLFCASFCLLYEFVHAVFLLLCFNLMMSRAPTYQSAFYFAVRNGWGVFITCYGFEWFAASLFISGRCWWNNKTCRSS